MSPEDELLRGLKRGDADAFEELVNRFEAPLYRYFLASHGDKQLAGEQTVDCFSELLRALPKMSGDASRLRPFVFAVARNVLRRLWRRSHREAAPLDTVSGLASDGPTPSQAAESREELARVLAVINTLDPATREVFVLRFVEQLPLAEVAEVVGEPLGTIKSRVHRGRRRLAELLQTAAPVEEKPT